MVDVREPLRWMADGTLKQVNPFSGTQVWTVPGRGNRPIGRPPVQSDPLGPVAFTHTCAFCSGRTEQTPPEKTRLDKGVLTRGASPALAATPADFRRIPNLFEIVSFEYWNRNYGYELDDVAAARLEEWLADPAGIERVAGVVEAKLKAAGHTGPAASWAAFDAQMQRNLCAAFFGGCHDVIVARRHYVDGAATQAELASVGTLTPAEHRDYIAITVDALRDLYATNRYIRYVQVFQNWLAPAGASFDHLHKQLVGIDERGSGIEAEIALAQRNPNLYNDWGVNYAHRQNLVVAANEHAVAFAGFGHRYPSLEVYSRSGTTFPWEQSAEERDAMADLLHALHAAAGPHLASNEEWHHQPPEAITPMPWRVVIKWRVSTLAGFEGGSKINTNTIDPFSVRDRVTAALRELRVQGKVAPLSIAEEVELPVNPLRYLGK
ncbi:MAG: DUF4921 family protein [Buchananella hordeovulneris]|nr:DUF4921 family protein [Buchananella hordeovulneris]